MEEKDKFINDIKEKSKNKDILEGIKFEDSMEYRFKLVEDDAYERGIEQNTIDMIKSMLNKNYSYEDIADISGKSLEEIKDIEKSI